ncbi:MAG: imidazolonepropionase [Sphingomonadales bacterium]
MAPGAAYGAIQEAALAVEGTRIAWIGKAGDLPDRPADLAGEVFDAGERWITPGLIDCHTHLVHGGNRAREFALRLEGASYEEIARAGGGILSTVAATREATDDALFDTSLRRLAALRAEGVTTVEIKSGYGLDTDSEVKMLGVARRLAVETGMRVRKTFLGAHTVAPEYAGRADAYVDLVAGEMLPRAMSDGLADAVDAFCETIAFSPEQVARVFDAARRMNLPVKLHADQLSDLGGAALAARYGALSVDHMEYSNLDGIEAMAKTGSVAVLLPGAFYFLGEIRKPPIDLLRRHGVPIAIATDSNPGSSPVTSLLLMLNMACTIFGLTPEEALTGVTRNAAKALGLAGECGVLAPGMAADFVLWDIEDPAELSYRLGFNPCAGVVMAGEPVAGIES